MRAGLRVASADRRKRFGESTVYKYREVTSACPNTTSLTHRVAGVALATVLLALSLVLAAGGDGGLSFDLGLPAPGGGGCPAVKHALTGRLDLPDPEILAWITGSEPIPPERDTPLLARVAAAPRAALKRDGRA